MKVVYFQSIHGRSQPKSFINSLPTKDRARVFSLFKIIEQGDIQDPRIDTRKIVGTDLWEIRIIQKNSIRLLYFAEYLQKVVILHGFIKKSQKTPTKHVETALNRYFEWKKKHS